MAVLRCTLDAALRGAMLEPANGELPTPALQELMVLAYLLVIRGAAPYKGAALLARRLRLRPASEPAS